MSWESLAHLHPERQTLGATASGIAQKYIMTNSEDHVHACFHFYVVKELHAKKKKKIDSSWQVRFFLIAYNDHG